MDDLRPPLPDDSRQCPRRGKIHLVARGERHEVGAFRCAAVEHALGLGDEHGAVAERAQPQDCQEDLVLSAAPGAGGVDVECEHSSHSFANLRQT